MQRENIFTILKSMDPPSELILMMTKGIRSGVVTATLVASTVFAFLMYDFVPMPILFFWLLAELTVLIVRVDLAKKLEKYVDQENSLQRKYLQYTIIATGVSAVLWGLTSWLGVLYAPENYTYYVLFVLFVLTAGATTTLGSIFHAYFLFMSIILLMLSSSFIYYGGEFHLIIALGSLVAITILAVTGSDYYLKLRKITELSNELKLLNTDLQERVQQEVQNNAEKDIQLMQQARLAQMGEIISMITHQWRQPLNIISTAATDLDIKLQMGLSDQNVCQKNITMINQLTQHLSNTIDDFRDFFKVTKERESTSIDDVVKASLNIIKDYTQNHDITITTDLNSTQTFYSYPNELKQVLINLIRNAQDALLETKVDNATIHLRSFSDTQHHYLEVCDNAGGIDTELMDKIFDAYFTTKEEDKGTGLGLYMSKKIIEEHCGGTLEVVNSEQGACFRITLAK